MLKELFQGLAKLALVGMMLAAPLLPDDMLAGVSVVLAQDVGVQDEPAPEETQVDVASQMDVQGQWDGRIQVTRGPGAGRGEACSFMVEQDDTAISGSGSCAASGAGACSGTLADSTFHLTCSNPVYGVMAITATIESDGTLANGAFSSTRGSTGTYTATRAQE